MRIASGSLTLVSQGEQARRPRRTLRDRARRSRRRCSAASSRSGCRRSAASRWRPATCRARSASTSAETGTTSSSSRTARIGLVVGDVVGKGVQAAAMMGQLRNALRAFAFEYDDPHTVVSRLDKLVEGMIDSAFATLVYLVVDPHAAAGAVRRCGTSAAADPLARRHDVVPRAGALAPDRRRRLARVRGGRGASSSRARRSCSTPTASSSAAARRSTRACGRLAESAAAERGRPRGARRVACSGR